MLKTNQYINNDQCRRNGGGVLSFSKEDEKIARKNYYEKLLKTEFGCDTISGVHTLKNKCMVGESTSNLKNEDCRIINFRVKISKVSRRIRN